MHEIKKAVVIPCYKVANTIGKVINGIPDGIANIIVVDDKCPQQSGKIAEGIGDKRVTVIRHEKNQGVGGAVISGYQKAMELGCDIVIKMDGDGQMDPCYIDMLIDPVLRGEADYTKGNRFVDFKALKKMPKSRLIGNNIMSFIAKVYSGYWNLMDPANGYTAIGLETLKKLDFARIAKNYFFETNMLLNLYLVNAVVKDVPIPARYEGETSSFTWRKFFFQYPFRLVHGFLKRILLRYFVYDFNMGSVYIIFGLPLFLWSLGFGITEWIDSCRTGVTKSAGTIMFAALPLIISFEMLLQAINIDINNVPRKK